MISVPGTENNMPEFSKRFVIFCLGFFSLVAQTLLFRDFLTVMEGNELAIGFFFFSWLIWISAGALAGRLNLFSKKSVADSFELVALIYIPALLIQQYLLLNIRQISGTASFEQLSLAKAIPLLFISNAPVSFMTGLLFVLACRWMTAVIPASSVYIAEALGSFAGAIAVTILLFYKISPGTIIPSASLLLITSSFLCLFILRKNTVRILTAFLFLIANAVFLITGCGEKMQRHYVLSAWERMLPGGEYRGNFTTSQAKYSYGKYADQFIISAWGSVYESLPDSINAIETAALNLAEKPDAQNILVAGNGSFSLCSVLASLKQVRKVYWLDPDVEYPENLLKVIPPEYRKASGKIQIPSRDIRHFLNGNRIKYDLIIMNMPNPSTLLLNRYFTLENFMLLKNSLSEQGVLSVSFPGGDNYMGSELSYSGASLFMTLKKAFRYIAFKPGDSSIFFVSDEEGVLSEDASVLEKRLLSVEGISMIYSPKNVASSFMKERIKFQKDKYLEIMKISRQGELVNSDSHPKSYLYCLLFALKKTGGMSFDIFYLRQLTRLLFPVLAVMLTAYGIFRILLFSGKNGKFKFSIPPVGIPGEWDILFIIFAASLAGMVLNIILIFRYQMVFGSVFLNFGILSSLFMLGNFGGGNIAERIVKNRGWNWYYIPLTTLFFAFFVIWTDMLPTPSQTLFGVLIFLSGFFSGVYFPLAAFLLRAEGKGVALTGSSLEALDCLGGATGSMITALIMLPLIGARMSMALLLVILAIVLVHSIILSCRS